MEPEIIGNRIKLLMQKNSITIEKLSEQLGINVKELKIKLEGKEEFYLNEMKTIKEIFNLNEKDVDELFFKNNCNV